MAIKIASITLTPQSVKVNENVLIAIEVTDTDWETVKQNYDNWNAINTQFNTWEAFNNYNH